MRCHVMSCHVMSCHVMSCYVIICINRLYCTCYNRRLVQLSQLRVTSVASLCSPSISISISFLFMAEFSALLSPFYPFSLQRGTSYRNTNTHTRLLLQAVERIAGGVDVQFMEPAFLIKFIVCSSFTFISNTPILYCIAWQCWVALHCAVHYYFVCDTYRTSLVCIDVWQIPALITVRFSCQYRTVQLSVPYGSALSTVRFSSHYRTVQLSVPYGSAIIIVRFSCQYLTVQLLVPYGLKPS
jgi:hypothetical protein